MHFIEILGQHNYLALPQGNTIISYIIKIMESDPSVSRGWAGRGPRMGAHLRGWNKRKAGLGARGKGEGTPGTCEGSLASKTLSSEPGKALNTET